jgi:hypothetical protein
MLAWLRKLVPERRPTAPSEARALALSQVLGGRCPRCRGDLQDHSFQLFAITVATAERKEALSDFISKARKHDWDSLSKFQDFNSLENALEVHALRCADQKLNMLLVRDPSELFDGHSVEDWEALDQNESSKWLSSLNGAKWICFATASSPAG